jgi:hypothetical protein
LTRNRRIHQTVLVPGAVVSLGFTVTDFGRMLNSNKRGNAIWIECQISSEVLSFSLARQSYFDRGVYQGD